MMFSKTKDVVNFIEECKKQGVKSLIIEDSGFKLSFNIDFVANIKKDDIMPPKETNYDLENIEDPASFISRLEKGELRERN